MKPGHCKHCAKYNICSRACQLLKAELARTTRRRVRKRVKTIPISNLKTTQNIQYQNLIYASYEDKFDETIFLYKKKDD